eukprot:TRINITY_DN103241_c0_g1_i1.p1 TRINITY_DN103241_c0_g1~~TRINITY_DN103241_c0_g1_i1.p1  ORF type:complete len:301 (-),score=106.97 TRINITY_DN103241_c0_g1_i1:148-978(-)
MGNCDSKVAEVATEFKDEAPISQKLSSEEVPLWKLVADNQAKDSEAAAEAIQKWEAEEAAKKEQQKAEEAAKAEESAKAEAAAKKDAAAKKSKAKKKPAAPKKNEAEAEAAAEDKPAEAAPAPPAAGGPMDRAQIKERDQAFAKLPKKEQEDLGKQMRVAAKEGNLIEVKSLCDKGVSPNVPDKDSWIALMEASQAGHAECCQVLLDFGGDAKATLKLGEWGMTALHFAARNGHLECAKIIAPASKLEEKNFQSKTAAEVAKANGHKDIAKICKVK